MTIPPVAAAEPGQSSFPVFGTTAHLLVTDPGTLPQALRLLRTELAAIDAACSRFRPDSELSRVNAAAGTGHAVTVGLRLAEALEVALTAAEESGGLVDPTVGAAVVGLGYDRTFASLRPEQLGTPVTAPAPGRRAIEWDPARRRLRLPAGTALDLGATAKAWAADRAARLLAASIGCGVLVNLGGDLAVSGATPAGGWRIAVADDHRAPAPDSPVVAVTGGGIATSGTAVRTWRRDGHPVHHVVDPRSGRNPEPCWRTVTVAAATCVAANTAATAALVLGPEAPTVLRHAGLPARLVHVDGTVLRLGGWPEDTPAPAPGDAA
ncbi:FAD:protein FMN transferase [Streptacidiphilus jiangxiensis]|uniref:FAD:protein FMN transferase n=1 Tax=Streptacidiphilus jiangxiensis TaxID=235985 RepID=A0A1H7V539_STRJI|nr:FAD:protein FMN transferase [Streptacidiphilus jiangxiensis]SEM04179.1 thiamine biosynthesis lipoprotein [Streptacidiphilus jiangxiensis]